LRTTDEQTGQYLRIFTFLPLPKVDEILSEHTAQPESRLAQHVLAEELVTLVHGSQVTQRCISQTRVLYPAEKSSYNVDAVIKAFDGEDRMFTKIGREAFFGRSIARLLKDLDIVSSYGIPAPSPPSFAE
jgi:tyrosyl-tRNA synthetase